MLKFHLNISKSQRQAMEKALAKARQQNDLRNMKRDQIFFCFIQGLNVG